MRSPRDLRPLVIAGVLVGCLLAFGCKNKDVPLRPPGAQGAAAALQAGTVFREGFTEQSVPGQVQPTRAASTIDEKCSGYIGPKPTMTITIEEDMPLKIHLFSLTDTVLVLKGSSRVICREGSVDHGATIADSWPKGRYELYVGSLKATQSPLSYRLDFEHFEP